MDEKLRRFYRFVKDQPCCACGRHATTENPVEAAHVKAVRSFKTWDMMPRRRDHAIFSAVPLCRQCHAAQHDLGEAFFFENRLGSREAVYLEVATMLAGFMWEQMEGP